MKLNDVKNVLAESWDRTKAETFTLASFQDVDKALADLDEDGQNEIRQACEEYLQNNAKSIVALYAIGCIFLSRHPQEDNLNLLQLAETFQALKNWEVVDFLCGKILAVSENRHALRILAQAYESRGEEDAMFAIYERLIKADHDEIDIVRQVADRYERKGDADKAVAYYRIALERVLAKQDVGAIKPLFASLFALRGDDWEYFLGLAGKVSLISPATGVALLQDMEKSSKDDVDKQIVCEKKILTLEHDAGMESDEVPTKNNLIANFRKKYAGHSRLETCLKESGLLHAANHDIIHEIEEFEKNISFDKGTFVWQSSRRRIGRIRSIGEKEVVIDFVGQKDAGGTSMAPEMAFQSLTALKKSNILVLKGCVAHEKLAAKTLAQPAWMLNILLDSHGGKSSLKQMKKELVPEVLNDAQWSTWSKQAKDLLMNDPHYGVSPDDDSYILRETPITYEEKQLSIFNAHTAFYDKVKDLKKFIADKGDTDSEYFYEMVKYFSNILEARQNDAGLDDETLGSYLLLDDLLNHRKMTFIKIPQNVTFSSLINRFEDKEKIPALFGKIEDADLKKCFIDWTLETQKNWSDLLLKLFPYYLNTYIPTIYAKKRKSAVFNTIYRTSVENYRDYAGTLFYLIKNASKEDWEKGGITQEQLLYAKLTLLSFLNQKIESRVDGQESSANAKVLTDMLFGIQKRGEHTNGEVYDAIATQDENVARNLYSLVQSCTGLAEGEKIKVKFEIEKRWPDIDLNRKAANEEVQPIVPTGWFCTAKSLQAKKDELEHIQHVDLPDVAKEIAVAREKGDLRENSEFQYGKDKRHLLQKKEAELKAEIDKAIVKHRKDVDPDRSGFGTEVVVADTETGKETTYRILGPWESDPERNIINILAPLGGALCNRHVGEKFSFTLGDVAYHYQVVSIKVLDID